MIDFRALNVELLSRVGSLMREWLRDGNWQGAEWVALNPTRADRHLGSFKVNLQTGKWGDFAAGDGAEGNDLTSLFAYLQGGLKQTEAARRLIENLGLSHLNGSKRPPDVSYKICNASGELIAIHHRLEARDGEPKRVWWERNGKNGLDGLKVHELPLYSSERIASYDKHSTIVVFEGEKCTERALKFGLQSVSTACAAKVTPCKESLKPLLDFDEVILWLDADDVGRGHMRKIGARLLELGFSPDKLRWLESPLVPGLEAEGADIADLDDDGVRAALDGAVVPFPQPSTAESPVTETDESGEPRLPDKYCDIALSNRFVEEYGDGFLYVPKLSAWFVYDKRALWIEDEKLQPYTLTRQMLTRASREIFQETLAEADNEAKARTAASYVASARTVNATVSLARAHPRIAALLSQFDVDPWLLNTPAGVVDLRDGNIRPARRDEYFTKVTVVAPTHIPTPLFDQFLLDIMGAQVPPDICECAACAASDGIAAEERESLHLEEVRNLVAYLKRLYGYCLSGDVSEHVLALQIGRGGNGKGVLNDLISEDIMGLAPIGYACNLPIEALLASKGERHPTDLMCLFHSRLALARESDEETNWNESRVKTLTGGDPVTARRMRQDFVTFAATHKVVPFGNAPPALHGADQSAWRRRVHMIRFPQQWLDQPNKDEHILQADKDLRVKLRAEAPGILQILIDGCLEYREQGLNPPLTIRRASEIYLQEQNVIQRFLDDCGDRSNPYETSTVSELWGAALKWANRNNVRIGDRKDFNNRLRNVGVKITRTSASRGICQGIKLLPAQKDEV